MHITRMQPDQLDEVAALVALLQADPAHHIAFFGERPDDIAQYIRELGPAGTDGFVLAYEGETLIGLLGVEADPEVRRAWLLSFPTVHEVALTVYSRNSAALALYTQLGYEHLHTVQAYRKVVLANS